MEQFWEEFLQKVNAPEKEVKNWPLDALEEEIKEQKFKGKKKGAVIAKWKELQASLSTIASPPTTKHLKRASELDEHNEMVSKKRKERTLFDWIFASIFWKKPFPCFKEPNQTTDLEMQRINSTYTFKEWVTWTNYSAIAEVLKDGIPMILKVSYDKEIFQNEKSALELMKGQRHTIALQDSFALEKCNCYGLLFKKYTGKKAFHPETETELCSYMYQLLQALDHIHGLKYMHRDVKPSNIFYNKESDSQLDVVLGDFGLATHITGDDKSDVGTVPYMAPEMLDTFSNCGYAVDIWAAGVVFVELLFERCPFQTDETESLRDIHEVFFANKDSFISSTKQIIFPELWKRQKGLIFRMLEKDPDLRITAKEALKILKEEMELHTTN